MKRLFVFFILMPLFSFAAGSSAEEMALYWAHRNGAKVKEVLRVVDQDGVPVVGAKMKGGMRSGPYDKDVTPIRGVTDTNGMFVIEGKCTDIMQCGITYDNYYESRFRIMNYGGTHELVDGKWHPYGTQRTIILNKIINPQPLAYHNARTWFDIPVYNTWTGFDLEKYDFVPPYGKGSANDVLLRFTLNKTSIDDHHMTMDVSFTNNPYAGAYEMKKNKLSELESVYRADTNATYRTFFSYKFDRWPGKGSMYEKYLSSDEYLIFRTRTKIDDEGRLVSAHYGKIYGEWNFVGTGGMSMEEVMFNSTPNDTNLEDLHTAERSRISKRSFEQKARKKKKRKSL